MNSTNLFCRWTGMSRRSVKHDRRLQRSFADGFITEGVSDLWEPWMRHADEALNADRLLETIQKELSKRLKKSRTRGHPGSRPKSF